MVVGSASSPVREQLVWLRAAHHSHSHTFDELFDARIHQQSWEVIEINDVYRAMAWLCARKVDGRFEHTPRVVVACVDHLAAEEFEFFALVAQLRPDLAVLVYGRDGSPGVGRALQAGARGVFTPSALESLRTQVKGAVRDDVPTAGPIEDPIASPAPHSAAGVEAEEEEEVLSEPAEEEELEAAPPTRVPWRTYDDRPQRLAPPRRPNGNGADSRPTGSGASGSRRSTPLLSEEELRALIGDDISSLAPPEPGFNEENVHGHGEGDPHDSQRRG